MQLTEKEKERYNRQIQLDEIGEKGQTLLRQAKILIWPNDIQWLYSQ